MKRGVMGALSIKKSLIQPLRLLKAVKSTTEIDALFENLPKLLSPKMIEAAGIAAASTVYDWKYRPEKYECPSTMFAIKRTAKSRLKIHRDILKDWISSWEEK